MEDNKEANPTQTEAVTPDTSVEKIKHEFLGGISWFYWIGGLSIVNILVGFIQRKFIFGLGITEFIGDLATSGATMSIPLLALSVALSGVFIWLGYKGRQGSKSLIMAGLVFYGIDTALMVVASDWLSVAFHAYAGYSIFKGYQALGKIIAQKA